jgi:hypothetical protein
MTQYVQLRTKIMDTKQIVPAEGAKAYTVRI